MAIDKSLQESQSNLYSRAICSAGRIAAPWSNPGINMAFCVSLSPTCRLSLMRGTPFPYKVASSHVLPLAVLPLSAQVYKLEHNTLAGSSMAQPVFVVDVSRNGKDRASPWLSAVARPKPTSGLASHLPRMRAVAQPSPL